MVAGLVSTHLMVVGLLLVLDEERRSSSMWRGERENILSESEKEIVTYAR